ncbi:uncharacterized protein [Venturia canescens]|uniref:uncharacterized protein n=1 Tax=Venturia canescens TaxID=32260 RepID=UPI001C9C2CAE|nr:uncharacterized protein LOC122417347 [Venturia canescens]
MQQSFSPGVLVYLALFASWGALVGLLINDFCWESTFGKGQVDSSDSEAPTNDGVILMVWDPQLVSDSDSNPVTTKNLIEAQPTQQSNLLADDLQQDIIDMIRMLDFIGLLHDAAKDVDSDHARDGNVTGAYVKIPAIREKGKGARGPELPEEYINPFPTRPVTSALREHRQSLNPLTVQFEHGLNDDTNPSGKKL